MDASWEVKPYRFAVVGAGWRTLFYLRVVSALAHRFQVTGVLARSQQRAEEVHQAWGVAATATLEELLSSGQPEFVVLSVPRAVTVEWLEQLSNAGMAVLCETPPAADLSGLHRVTRLVLGGRGYKWRSSTSTSLCMPLVCH